MRSKLSPPNDAQQRIAPLAKLPVFWDLEGKSVVLAGGSDGAAWKAELLIACGAVVDLYCPEEALGEAMRTLLARGPLLSEGRSSERGCLLHHPRPWRNADLPRASLALADCEEEKEAETFFLAAKHAGVPVNVIDKPRFCQFQFGSIVNRSPVVVSISTDGAAPILAQAIRRRIETLLPPVLRDWAQLAQRLRDRINETLEPGPSRRSFWEYFVDRCFSSLHSPAADTESMILAEAKRLAVEPAKGKLTVVGAGPGDAELLTLKAVRALQAADVIFFDPHISTDVLELARREAKRMLVGDTQEMYDAPIIDSTMLGFARAGKRVVRLVTGSGTMNATQAKAFADIAGEGIVPEVVPGINAPTSELARTVSARSQYPSAATPAESRRIQFS